MSIVLSPSEPALARDPLFFFSFLFLFFLFLFLFLLFSFLLPLSSLSFFFPLSSLLSLFSPLFFFSPFILIFLYLLFPPLSPVALSLSFISLPCSFPLNCPRFCSFLNCQSALPVCSCQLCLAPDTLPLASLFVLSCFPFFSSSFLHLSLSPSPNCLRRFVFTLVLYSSYISRHPQPLIQPSLPAIPISPHRPYSSYSCRSPRTFPRSFARILLVLITHFFGSPRLSAVLKSQLHIVKTHYMGQIPL